jgi:hypothetical protein
MSPEIISAIASAIVVVLGSFFAFTKWMITKFLSELKPNGGSSIKDQINRLEQRVDDVYFILAERLDK